MSNTISVGRDGWVDTGRGELGMKPVWKAKRENLSLIELVANILKRIEKINSKLNVYLTIVEEKALQ
jgi:Asp-tRNA(Asn)/Glu-tRNA(Gln) amidotransferase A subunit family amidase